MDVAVRRLALVVVVISVVGLRQSMADFIMSDQAVRKCPNEWVELHRGCYKFVGKSRRQRQSWQDANSTCGVMGGQLASIQSVKEKENITDYLTTNKYKSSLTWWVYLVKTAGAWNWEDGSVVSENETPWKSSQIRDRPRNPCGVIDMKKGFRLSNSACRHKKGFICEFHQLNPRPSTFSAVEDYSSEASNYPAKVSTASSTRKITSESTTTFARREGVVRRVTQATPTSPIDKAGQNIVTHFTYPPKTKRVTKPVAKAQTTRSQGVRRATPTKTTHSEGVERITPTKTTHSEDVERITPTKTTHSEGIRRIIRSTSPYTIFTTTLEDDSDKDTDTGTEIEETESTTPMFEYKQKTSHKISKITPLTKAFTSAFSKGAKIRMTSPVFVAKTTATATTDENDNDVTTTDANDNDNDDGDEKVTEEEIDDGTDDNGETTGRPFLTPKTKGVRYSRTSPTLGPTTTTTTGKRRPIIPHSLGYWLEALEEYEGCYIPGMRVSAKQVVRAARRLYKDDADHCPQITAARLTFPSTEAGETAVVKCRRGSGFATLDCGDDTVCWEDEPDLSGCASPKFKALLAKIKETQIETMVSPDPDEEEEDEEMMERSVNVTSQLVEMTDDDDISMEDILVTSEVLTAFTQSTEDRKVKAKDKKSVRKIVGNVVKAGNNLLSKKRKKMWKNMQREDKVRSASSLMVAMETATLSMADKIEEPSVIKQIEENIEVEIQVVDVDKLEEDDEDEVVYDSEDSDNSFSIPLENLKTTAKEGKLDTIVFITHYSMAEFLDSGVDEDDDDNDDEGSQKVTIISRSEDSNTTINDNKGFDAGGGGGGAVPNKDENTVQTGGEEEKGGTAEDEKEEEEEEEDSTPQIASYIMSATIGGGEGHKKKLPKNVTFTMKHTMEILQGYRTLCSFWDISQGGSQGFWSQEGCQVKRSNRTHTSCECNHMTSFAILIDVNDFETTDVHQTVLRLITIIGCVISCVCLVVSWFTFQFCAALQGERNSIHKNLAACLFVSELLFVAGVTHTEPKTICSVVAVFLHFFFLAAFTWMFLEGLHIIFMLVQVFDASRSRLPHYYIAGYGFPAVVVGISCIAYFDGYGTEEFCWLTTDRYLIWAFAGPVSLILLVNAVFLTYAMTTVCRHSDYVFNAKDRGTSPVRSWIQGALALEVLLGLTWSFGYFLLDSNTLPLAYAFTVLNSLQGMFIFIFHCALNKKAQKEYLRILQVPLGMSSIFSTQSTSGKHRTNGSTTKSNEMTHSTTTGRKHSLNYKHSNSNGHNHPQQHNNYFRDSNHFNAHDNNTYYSSNGGVRTSKDVGDGQIQDVIPLESSPQNVV